MSQSLLIDTNIISFEVKNDTRTTRYKTTLDNNTLYISVITVGELRFWTKTRHWQQARIQKFEQYLRQTYTAVGIDDLTCTKWSEVLMASRSQGKGINANDAWIAVTALRLNIPLVTHNPKDFNFIPNLNIITFP